MIVERSMQPQFLSNTYLVAGDEGQPAFFVDAGGPVAPLIEAAERLSLTPSHLLLTHHHFDHVSEADRLLERWPSLEVLIHPLERALASGVPTTGTIEAGQTISIGELRVSALHTPGHTLGMLSLLVQPAGSAEVVLGGPDSPASRAAAASAAGSRGREPRSAPSARGSTDGGAAEQGGRGEELAVFTGDTLFKGSVGGVHAPGHATYIDLKDSIMGTLMELPSGTTIYPGHMEASTVQQEWDHNLFVRLWRGVDREGCSGCKALGREATLVLSCPDYDGGRKVWVRWPNGEDDIVPGSQVSER